MWGVYICTFYKLQVCSQLYTLSPLRVLRCSRLEMTQQHHLLSSGNVTDTTVMHHLLTCDTVHRVTVNFLLERQMKRKGQEATHLTGTCSKDVTTKDSLILQDMIEAGDGDFGS